MSKSKIINDLLTNCDKCPIKDDVLRQARARKKSEQLLADEMCSGCDTFHKIRALSGQIKDEETLSEQYLKKGEDMTTRELLYLLENGIPRNRIQKHLKMTRSELVELINDIGRGYSS